MKKNNYLLLLTVISFAAVTLNSAPSYAKPDCAEGAKCETNVPKEEFIERMKKRLDFMHKHLAADAARQALDPDEVDGVVEKVNAFAKALNDAIKEGTFEQKTRKALRAKAKAARFAQVMAANGSDDFSAKYDSMQERIADGKEAGELTEAEAKELTDKLVAFNVEFGTLAHDNQKAVWSFNKRMRAFSKEIYEGRRDAEGVARATVAEDDENLISLREQVKALKLQYGRCVAAGKDDPNYSEEDGVSRQLASLSTHTGEAKNDGTLGDDELANLEKEIADIKADVVTACKE